MLTEADIQRIVSRIVAGTGALAVGVFGSYAIMRASENSDLDLFVIQHTTQPSSARRRIVMKHLFGVQHPLDVHVFTPEEFEEGVRETLSFPWIIVRQAKVYHWTDGAVAVVPSLTQWERSTTPTVDGRASRFRNSPETV